MLTDDQIALICEEKRQNPSVQGILLTGSYAYGKPRPDSDLDLRIVTGGGVSWAERDTWRFGVRIEAYCQPPEMIRAHLARCRETGIESTVHGWAHGTVLYDPAGIVASLQSEARDIWQMGPYHGTWKKGSHHWSRRLRYKACSLTRSIGSLLAR